MNKLSFNILPSEFSNDHQVRIQVDDYDLLGNDYLGIDPPEFFKQENLNKNGELMIGRCDCGCPGCSDYPVTVTVKDDVITWTSESGLNLSLNKVDYENTIASAKKDFSWEDLNRRAERLVNSILVNTTVEGYSLSWASARIKAQVIVLSYNKDQAQKLVEIKWDGQTEKSAEVSAEEFKKSLS